MFKVSIKIGKIDTDESNYFVEQQHLHNFLLAFIKLHHTPGKNPYNNNTTSKLVYIKVTTPRKSNGFWWTSPTLHEDKAVPFIEYSSYLSGIDIYLSPDVNPSDDKSYVHPDYRQYFVSSTDSDNSEEN